MVGKARNKRVAEIRRQRKILDWLDTARARGDTHVVIITDPSLGTEYPHYVDPQETLAESVELFVTGGPQKPICAYRVTNDLQRSLREPIFFRDDGVEF